MKCTNADQTKNSAKLLIETLKKKKENACAHVQCFRSEWNGLGFGTHGFAPRKKKHPSHSK